MTDKEYRELDGISRSELLLFRKSPSHFLYQKENPREDTDAFAFGRAVHCYLLEGREVFFDNFAIAPEVNRRTKEGKQQYEVFCDVNAGKTIISQEQWETLFKMVEVVKANEDAANLLSNGVAEQPIFWTDSQTGERCKIRPDWLNTKDKVIVDYKTASDLSDGVFERDARKYGYKVQSGMYREGVFNQYLEDYSFVFIAQEKTAPFAVRIYECSPDYIEEGYDEFRALLGMYHECKERGEFPSYGGFDHGREILYGER